MRAARREDRLLAQQGAGLSLSGAKRVLPLLTPICRMNYLMGILLREGHYRSAHTSATADLCLGYPSPLEVPMKYSTRLAATGVAVGLATLSVVSAASASTPSTSSAAGGKHAVRVCGTPAKGDAACLAQVMVSNSTGKPAAIGSPSGYNPPDIQSAYNLSGSSTATVAIVDAYNDPYAESDLAVYRSQFGLPACTTANGCFKKVNQYGSTTSYPRNNASWSQEISLDLDMVSAICPKCHILLVEANSASLADLGTAVNTAARLGATE